MSLIQATYRLRTATVAILLLFVAHLSAQVTIGSSLNEEGNIPVGFSKEYALLDTLSADILQQNTQPKGELSADSSRVSKKRNGIEVSDRIRNFKPEPYKATWLAVVIPGAGQIYNRKYWKLPIVYGGFMGCLYAYNWNNQMYSDYRQAFLDIMDADPNSKSYETFFPSGYDFERNEEYLKELFKKRKNRYRRWRDLSVFACVGVYLVSIVDAYVDAHLSSFDISEDVNLSIHPDVQPSGAKGNYYGLNCNISF